MSPKVLWQELVTVLYHQTDFKRLWRSEISRSHKCNKLWTRTLLLPTFLKILNTQILRILCQWVGIWTHSINFKYPGLKCPCPLCKAILVNFIILWHLLLNKWIHQYLIHHHSNNSFRISNNNKCNYRPLLWSNPLLWCNSSTWEWLLNPKHQKLISLITLFNILQCQFLRPNIKTNQS